VVEFRPPAGWSEDEAEEPFPLKLDEPERPEVDPLPNPLPPLMPEFEP
jgi:hypothetical protein